MQDYILTIELSMDNIPYSDDFKTCILDAFATYCKKHPEEKVVLKYMHLTFDEHTLAHRDVHENWYLPNVVKRVPVKRVSILRGR